MRTFFTDGKYRHIEAILLCLIFFIVFFFYHGHNVMTSLASFFKTATFILTSMGLVAYNLRNKVIDNVVKMIQYRSNYKEISEKSKRCGEKLTLIVILSIISLCVTYFASVFPSNKGSISYFVISTASILFIWCTVLYLHILLTFDNLEQDILNSAVEQRDVNEREKLKAYIEAGEKEHPDN